MKSEMASAEYSSAYETYQKISGNIQKVIKGQSTAIRLLLAGFASGGHVLLEDFPGTGKTTLAKTLALSIATDFKRIQFTPDLLPSDIIGVSIFDPKEKIFRVHKGPIFTNILLIDEINRASPRTQSALLEAMAERQVSIDGKIFSFDSLFFVIATQNPIESRGTYPLPEAQMDRFALQLSLGYVDTAEEVAILTDQNMAHPIENIGAVSTMDEVLSLKAAVRKIFIREELKQYIVEIVKATRNKTSVQLGASPRASLSLMKAVKALALIDGYDFVSPDHIQEIAVPVIAHRLVMDAQAQFSGQTPEKIVEEIIFSIPVPT